MEETRGDSSEPPDHGRSIWFGDADKTEIRRRCTMGEKQNRPVSLAGDQRRKFVGSDSDRMESRRPRGGRGAEHGGRARACRNPAGSARAQDTPAKNDAAAKPMLRGNRRRTPPSQEPEPASAEALSVRYRFIERYSLTEDPDHPERHSIPSRAPRDAKDRTRKAAGRARRFQFSRQTIYTERAAQVGKLGEVISAVRRYDKFQMKGDGGHAGPQGPVVRGADDLVQAANPAKNR